MLLSNCTSAIRLAILESTRFVLHHVIVSRLLISKNSSQPYSSCTLRALHIGVGMDTSGFCQVGRHGTLSLLKRQNVPVGDAGDGILTSFGIDDDELTFGSSTTCSVRLYYSDVDSLHCKIVFNQFKVNAFFGGWCPCMTQLF